MHLPSAQCLPVNVTEKEKYGNVVHFLNYQIRTNNLLGLSAHHLNLPYCIMALVVNEKIRTFFNPSITLLEKDEREIFHHFGQTPWMYTDLSENCEQQTVSLVVEENDIVCSDTISSFRRRFCRVHLYYDDDGKKREKIVLHGSPAFVAQNLYDTMLGYSPCLFVVDERF